MTNFAEMAITHTRLSSSAYLFLMCEPVKSSFRDHLFSKLGQKFAKVATIRPKSIETRQKGFFQDLVSGLAAAGLLPMTKSDEIDRNELKKSIKESKSRQITNFGEIV